MAEQATRHEWAASTMALRSGDRVLEIGCGAGLTLWHVCQRLGPKGRVVAMDRSASMIAAARRRNRTDVENGRLELIRGEYPAAGPGEGRFDAIYAFNVGAFADQPAKLLPAVTLHLKPAGRLHLFHQAPVAEKGERVVRQLARALVEHGFSVEPVISYPTRPAPAFGVVARRPAR